MNGSERAEGTTRIQSVSVSSQAFSFLFVTYKRVKSQRLLLRLNKADKFILKESNIMSTVINEAVDTWKEESRKPSDFYNMNLKFSWNTDKSKNNFLESDLVGKHDYFRLLEVPWPPSLGNLMEKIRQNLKDEKRINTKELIGVPCVAADFRTDEGYFVGGENAWFVGRDTNPVVLDSQRVHVLIFVDLKRGLLIDGRRLNLTDFLINLVYPRSESKKEYCLKKETRRSIKGIFLGYGLFELIFLLESPDLEDLCVSVSDIRRCFRRKVGESHVSLSKGTSTMVFMPQRTMMLQHKKSSRAVEYSILAAIETGADIEVSRDILELGKKGKITVYERQGYYDLIISFKESQFSKACETIEKIWDHPSVLSTSTIIKIDETRILEKFEKVVQ